MGLACETREIVTSTNIGGKIIVISINCMSTLVGNIIMLNYWCACVRACVCTCISGGQQKPFDPESNTDLSLD